MLFPRNLQIISQELAIVWNDGSESYLDFEDLRRACPCAVCQGEPDVLGQPLVGTSQPLTDQSFKLMGWELIGNYGLQPKWGDGHSSGIFTWEKLSDL